MKTAREWLKGLPEPYRKQALMNATVQYRERLDGKELSLRSAISRAFSWSRTKEGEGYWRDLYNRAVMGEFGPVSIDDNLPF